MTMPAQLPMLPSAPDEYNKAYMETVLQAITLHLRVLNSVGQITAAGMLLTALPTSSAGLPVGTLWNDGGTVKVVI